MKLTSNKRTPFTTRFQGIPVVFAWAIVGDRAVLVGNVPPEAEDEVRRHVRHRQDLAILPDDEHPLELPPTPRRPAARPQKLRPHEPPRPKPVAPTATDTVRAMALRQGWRAEDLDGAGNGTAGEQGGRGRLTALTLAEMAASVPPEGWAATAGRIWPWECVGWRPPHPAWRPPSAGNPPHKAAIAPVSPVSIVPAVPQAPPASPEQAPIVPAVPPEREPEVPVDPTPIEAEANAQTATAFAGYPAADVERALAIARDLQGRRKNKLPLNQLNFVLGEEKLPAATREQLAAFLAA